MLLITSLLKERVQVFLFKKELMELPDNSPNSFKKLKMNRRMQGPSTGFSNAKYSVLNNFYYGEFLTYYTVENKSRKTCKYQPDDFDDNLIGINHIERTYPPPTAQPHRYPHPFPEN